MKSDGSGARPRAARRGTTVGDDGAADASLFVRCPACKERSYRKDVERRLNVCASCGHHFRLTVEQRLLITVDRGSFVELNGSLGASDPLGWVDQKPYPERIAAAREETGHSDALVTGTAAIDEIPVALGIFDFAFMGGSMGTVVGEKLARLVEAAIERALPLVVFTASGGARMQEGTLSLFQMAKSASMLTRLREAGLPYLCVLTDPTTGGVAASLAMLGDVQIAEPHALIGFAGPRVIEQTIRQKLPEGFQRSEFLLEHGMIDAIVQRKDMKAKLSQLIGLLS